MLNNKVIVITGAASGIGLATAQRALAHGARVAAADIAQEPEDVASQGETAESWMFETVDVTDEAAVAAFTDAAAERFGRIDGLVNAAGVAGAGPVHALEAETWHRVLSINLTGTFHMLKHTVRHMLTQEPVNGERGSLVTLGSIEGLEGTAGGSVYNASKGGVVLLTKCVALDYGPVGIRANSICPGLVDTPMTQDVFTMPGLESIHTDFKAEHALGRAGRPDEIAAAATFLLSGDSSFITGEALAVDGGYTAGRDHGVTKLLDLRG